MVAETKVSRPRRVPCSAYAKHVEPWEKLHFLISQSRVLLTDPTDTRSMLDRV